MFKQKSCRLVSIFDPLLLRFSFINLFKFNGILSPLIIGTFSFALVVGFQSVNPGNIAWLQVGDPAQHYYGWIFYRYSDWTWPIGLNPNFGGYLASSIVYTDSIPLLAILLKPFSALLLEPFQYFGIFIFLCFIFQSIFGWLLVALFTPNYWIRFCGTLLILFSPPMMGRTVMTTSLAAHFLILASFYLSFRSNRVKQGWLWACVLCLAALIHAYLLGLVLAIWLANWLNCYVKSKTLQLSQGLIEIAIIAITLSFVCWQAGYFAIPLDAGAAGNYGLNGLDLLAFFDPNGWSYVVRMGTPYLFHTQDGFQYLGLGNFFLCSVALIGLFRSGFYALFAQIKNYPFLCLTLLFLILFSLTQNIHIGHWEFHYWLPERFIQLASIFRASSRMVWPIWYVLVLTSIWIVARSYSVKNIYIILGLAAIMQIVDTSAGWYPRKVELLKRTSSSLYMPLQDKFWMQAGLQYQEAQRLPHLNTATGFEVIANFAHHHQMSTNAANFSRFNGLTLQKANTNLDDMMRSGQYKQNTIYFLEKTHVIPSLAKIQESRDLIALVDNQFIIAPKWFERNPEWSPSSQSKILTKSLIGSQIHQPIFFNAQNIWTPLSLISGWAYPEAWGTWMVSHDGSINLLIPADAPNSITFNLRAFLYPGHETQKISIGINQNVPVVYALNSKDQNLITIPLEKKDFSLGYISIQMRSDSSKSPKDIGMGEDDRQLSIGLISATFN